VTNAVRRKGGEKKKKGEAFSSSVSIFAEKREKKALHVILNGPGARPRGKEKE